MMRGQQRAVETTLDQSHGREIVNLGAYSHT